MTKFLTWEEIDDEGHSDFKVYMLGNVGYNSQSNSYIINSLTKEEYLNLAITILENIRDSKTVTK